ncbi:unnamed protein product, partial [Closterium sp. NIES-54]
FKQAVTLRRQYSKGGAKGGGGKIGKAGGGMVSAGADALTVFVVDRIRQFCSWDTKHALLGAQSITSLPSSSVKRSSLKRLTSTPVNTNRRSLVLPASSVSATYPSPSPQVSVAPSGSVSANYSSSHSSPVASPSPSPPAAATGGGGGAAAAAKPPFSPSAAAAAAAKPLSPSAAAAAGDGAAAGAGVEAAAAALEPITSGVSNSSSGSGVALWSYAQLLDMIFERQSDDLPDWHDMATGMVEGLWAAIQAKAPLVAAAVADSGDGGDAGKKKEEEEKKMKKKSGFFKLGGGKEGKEKGDGGGKAGGGGGGGKGGGKVPVQEILRGLYLFNNAAYIQSLFPDLRMSKEYRQLADTQMNRFLDVLLKDMMASIGAPTTGISPAEFQKRLDAFNVAFEELCFNMRRFHVHDSVARTQIRGVCHERILSSYKEFLMPFR